MNIIIVISVLISIANSGSLVVPNITSWGEVADLSDYPDSANVIGFDFVNNEIDIFGGDLHEGLYSRFNPANEVYDLQENEAYPSGNVVDESKSYYQVYGSSTIYFLSTVGGEQQIINIADLTGTPEPDISGINLSYLKNINWTQAKPAICVNEAETKLYSIGYITRGDEQGYVHELDLINGGWRVWGDQLPNPIKRAACEVYGDEIFVFGGMTADDIVLNEILSCNITAEICGDIGVNPMIEGRADIEAVRIDAACSNYVVLIAGIHEDLTPSDYVEIFDMDTNAVYLAASLNVERKYLAAIYSPVNGRIWVFNGQDSSNNPLNSIESTPLSDELSCTMSPTVDPTQMPTEIPTIDPTEIPTVDPTKDPTVNPTKEPTEIPTSDPTEMPSTDPTKMPSTEPSETPTASPTTDTQPPSQSPTNNDAYIPDLPEEGTSDWVYVVLFLILAAICCIILLCAFFYDREEKKYVGAAAVPMVIAVACYKCNTNDCHGECGIKCYKCGTTACDGRKCGPCNSCGKDDCNGNTCKQTTQTPQ